MIDIFKFKTRGLGVVATKNIPQGTLIGNYFEKDHKSSEIPRYIYDGWFETPFFGRYLNHNRNPNCLLNLNNDVIELISKKDIKRNEELTVNYFDIVNLINLPEYEIKKHGIIDFEYIEEIVDLDDKQLI